MINVLDYWLITWLLTSLAPIITRANIELILTSTMHHAERVFDGKLTLSLMSSFTMYALNKKGMSLSKQISHIISLIKAKRSDVLQTIWESVAVHIFNKNLFLGISRNLPILITSHKCQHVHQLRSAAQDGSPTVLCSTVWQKSRFIRYSNLRHCQELLRVHQSVS